MLGSRTTLLVLVFIVMLGGCAASPGGPAVPSVDGSTATSPASSTTPGGTPLLNQTTTAQTVNGTLEVHFINVGQGASTLIVTPTGETMLIDSGDWRDEGEHVITYLDAQGIDRIDHLVTTHADADHIGGHAVVINYFETEKDGVGAVYDPGISASLATYERYLDAVEAHDVQLYETRAGDTLPLDGATVSVLGPPEPYLADKDRNENSIVLLVRHGETGFLFTGDAEAEQEEYLVDRYGAQLNVTVLQAGHHGSRSSTNDDLLDATEPQVAVISSAYDSQYGHPHTELLERLTDRSIPTYWTATHGTTALRSNGSAVEVWTQQLAPTTATNIRGGSAIEPGSDASLELRMTVNAALADGGPGTTETTAPSTAPPTTTTSTGGTGMGPLSLVEVHADAEGAESENLNDEYLVFENTGEKTLDLTGWQITDNADHTYTVPDGVTLAPGERVTLHTGSGTDTASDLYWGSDGAIWNYDGDMVTVTDSSGAVVLQEEYL